MWGGAGHEAWEVGGEPQTALGTRLWSWNLILRTMGPLQGIEKILTRSDLLKKNFFIVVKYT